MKGLGRKGFAKLVPENPQVKPISSRAAGSVYTIGSESQPA